MQKRNASYPELAQQSQPKFNLNYKYYSFFEFIHMQCIFNNYDQLKRFAKIEQKEAI